MIPLFVIPASSVSTLPPLFRPSLLFPTFFLFLSWPYPLYRCLLFVLSCFLSLSSLFLLCRSCSYVSPLPPLVRPCLFFCPHLLFVSFFSPFLLCRCLPSLPLLFFAPASIVLSPPSFLFLSSPFLFLLPLSLLSVAAFSLPLARICSLLLLRRPTSSFFSIPPLPSPS
jgi:hypothetical protein